MKKALATVLTLAMAFSLLTGCDNKPANSGNTTQAADATAEEETKSAGDAEGIDKTNIVVWTWFSEQLGPSVGKAFEEAYPEYTVEAVNIPSAELEQKLLAAITANSGLPDANAMQGDSIQKFIAFGGLMDLSDKVKPIADQFPAYKISNDTDAEGKIYGLPIDSGPCALYYQIDLAEECGIDPAVDFATYEAWIAAGEKYKDKGYALHRMTEVGDGGLLQMWTQQQGGTYFDENGNPTIDTPEFINSAQLLKDLWDSETTGDWADWTPQYNDAITGNQVGTLLGAAWFMNVFIHSFDSAENWAIVPLPTFPDSDSRTSNGGGSEMVIPEGAENPEGAWKFIEYYCADPVGRKIGMEALGEFPAYLPLYEDEEVQNKTMKYFGDQKVFSFFAELLPEVPDWRTPGPYAQVHGDLIGPECPKLISGELSPSEFAEYCQTRAEEIVKNYSVN